MLSTLAGAAGGLISVAAVFHADFWLFCLGTALVGVFLAFAQYYRLAAADAMSAEAKSRAISVVLAGGVIAGSALAAWAKYLFPAATFAGTYRNGRACRARPRCCAMSPRRWPYWPPALR